MIWPPPLHIEFVVTYENKNITRGYWFMTWIISPSNIKIWCKVSNGAWCLSAASKDVNLFEKGSTFATNEKAKDLDELLFKHIQDNNIPYEKPYKYWLDPGEMDPNDPEYYSTPN